MGEPCVSIGLPVYNGEEYLRVALDSLLEQTYPDFEVIVSDNASDDATESICRDYVARDPRLRYSRLETNQGVVVNSNRVFEMARGRYFRWASHDDFTAKDHLGLCVRALERNPDAVLSYTWTATVDAAGNVLQEDPETEGLDSSSIAERYVTYLDKCGWCNFPYGLIRSAALQRTRLFRDHIGSDHDLMLELLLQGPFAPVPEFKFFRRMHAGAASALDKEALAEHYGHAAREAGCDMNTWRVLGHRLATSLRSSAPVGDRRRIVGRLLRGAMWDRDDLTSELIECLRLPLRSRARSG